VSKTARHVHDTPVAETDQALVVAAQGGSAPAFEQLVNRYFGLIYTLAFARLREHEAAQDLTQEVFLRLYLGLPTLREPRFFGTWASRVARNLAMDWSRNRRRASLLITMVPLEASQVEQKPSDSPLVWERMLETEQMRELRAAILNLPVEQREILLLHYQRGMTQQEIGARLDMHHSTVCRHLQRAVEQLRRWSRDLEVLRTAPARVGAITTRERQALARTVVMLGAVAALGGEARASVAIAAAEGMAKLGAGAAPQAVSATSTAAAGAGANLAAIFFQGAVMTGKVKAGLVTLAGVAVLGTAYHQTHPGELSQLLRGTTPSNVRIKPDRPAAKTFHTPTMGPGEEVYEGRLGAADRVVVRMKPVAGGPPNVQFDVPGVLIMEYPMKVVSQEGDRYIIEAAGQFGLNVTRTANSLIGEARMYGPRQSDVKGTYTVELARIPAPVPIGRDFPAIVPPPDSEWLNQFVGEYMISSGMSLKVTRVGDQLYAQTPRQEPLPIYHMGNNRFFYRPIAEEITFFAGPDGKIVRMVMHLQRDTPGRKVS